jgi:hypothetical protein
MRPEGLRPPPPLSILCCYYYQQTLTRLNLRGNNAGDDGAQHVSTFLRSNQVISIIFSCFYYPFSIRHLDTDYIKSWLESNKHCWYRTSCTSIKTQHGMPVFLMI